MEHSSLTNLLIALITSGDLDSPYCLAVRDKFEEEAVTELRNKKEIAEARPRVIQLSGEMSERFEVILRITDWLSSLTDGRLGDIFQIIIIVGILLLNTPIIGCLMIVIIVFKFWFAFRTINAAKVYQRQLKQKAGDMSGVLVEMIANIAMIRSFNGESAMKSSYEEKHKAWSFFMIQRYARHHQKIGGA